MINKVILQGFVADEPRIHATDRGMLARVRMATMEYVPTKEGYMREVIEWHTVLLHGDLAHIVDRQVRIGTPIEIHGKLRSRKWVDRGGVNHDTAEVAANHLEILEQIEGYAVPRQITEKMPKAKKTEPLPEKITPPATDPDDLPF